MREPSDLSTTIIRYVERGTRLNGIYEIESLIASGGMGEVYRAAAIETGIPVAIKMIRPELAADETILALFRKEAASLHNLVHDAVVRYYVFSTDPDLRRPYLAMEYVEGVALSDLIQKGPLAPEAVGVLLRRIASALDVAHRAGIVHRDISPDNIILPDGDPARAKLIDFGIARSAFGGATVIGERFAGKVNFASPEQVGLFGGGAGPKSDIYSLGLTAAAALTGAPLDMGGTQVELVRRRQRLPDLADVPPAFRTLLGRMLQPKPDDRPGSMAEVAAWQLPEPGHTAGSGAKVNRRWAALAGIGAAVALSAGLGYVGSKYVAGPPGRPAAETVAAAPNPGASSSLGTGGSADSPAAPPPAASGQPTLPAAGAPAASSTPVAAGSATLSGSNLRDCPTCPELVAIPDGAFKMGSNADPTERPVHDVQIKGFLAGRYPVTAGEWRVCVREKGCAFDPGGEADAPVHNLSFDDTQQYVQWLSKSSGRRYRLLTEAEWEYAARAGSTTAYWWGDSFRTDRAACRTCGDPAPKAPWPVDRYGPNPFGIADVSGPVAQWVEDCWHKDYRGAPKDGSAWLAPQCRDRVLRGGSWMGDAAALRVASREFYEASVRYPGHGFRIARDR